MGIPILAVLRPPGRHPPPKIAPLPLGEGDRREAVVGEGNRIWKCSRVERAPPEYIVIPDLIREPTSSSDVNKKSGIPDQVRDDDQCDHPAKWERDFRGAIRPPLHPHKNNFDRKFHLRIHLLRSPSNTDSNPLPGLEFFSASNSGRLSSMRRSESSNRHFDSCVLS